MDSATKNTFPVSPSEPNGLSPLPPRQLKEKGRWPQWLWLLMGLTNGGRRRVFTRLERVFADQPEHLRLAKALWLTQRGWHLLSLGSVLQGRLCFGQALTEKPDFFPAFAGQACAYRQTGRVTGLGSFFCAGLDLLDTVPPQMNLPGGRAVTLQQAGSSVFSEMYNHHLLLGDPEQAANSLTLAIHCQEQAPSLDPSTLDFLLQSGCVYSPAALPGMRACLAKLHKLNRQAS
jgi:hypothetical protein